MRPQSLILRPGTRNDAVTVAALSVQVFLDTYATNGVRPDLAREALREYSDQAFLARLSTPGRWFVLAQDQDALLGFVEVDCRSRGAPVAGLHGVELTRLQRSRTGVLCPKWLR